MVLQRNLVLLISFITAGFSAPATYDQRQTGDLNVEVNLKNVQILALLDSDLLDDYTDYDYFYDYADFTIKPILTSTTASPSSDKPSDVASSSVSETTEKTDATEAADTTSQNLTLNSKPTSENTAEETGLSAATPVEQIEEVVTNATADAEDSSDVKTRSNGSVVDATDNNANTSTTQRTNLDELLGKPMPQLGRRRCKSGYSPSGNGRCRRRRLPVVPLALRFVENIQKPGDKLR